MLILFFNKLGQTYDSLLKTSLIERKIASCLFKSIYTPKHTRIFSRKSCAAAWQASTRCAPRGRHGCMGVVCRLASGIGRVHIDVAPGTNGRQYACLHALRATGS